MEYTYIGCCVGAYYHAVEKKIREKYRLAFISDRKLENDCIAEYDGIEVISRNKIKDMDNAVVIIFAYDLAIKNSLIEEFKHDGVKYLLASEIVGEIGNYTGSEIKANGNNGKFRSGSNIVLYDDTLPDNIAISFSGANSKVIIGKNLIVSRLSVNMGNDAECILGSNIQVVGAELNVSYANLKIGNDCLLARDIIFRTHDGHPIFDKTTGKRINYARDIVVGNHVWICANAKLMSGAKIGDGSVVAANALTSSEFPSNVIIAGIPAAVIRENIAWSKDTTVLFDFDNFEECINKDAEKYW